MEEKLQMYDIEVFRDGRGIASMSGPMDTWEISCIMLSHYKNFDDVKIRIFYV